MKSQNGLSSRMQAAKIAQFLYPIFVIFAQSLFALT